MDQVYVKLLTANCNPLQTDQAIISINAIVHALEDLSQRYGNVIFFAPLRKIADIAGVCLKTAAKWIARIRANGWIDRIFTGSIQGPKSIKPRLASIYDLNAGISLLFPKWGNTSLLNKTTGGEEINREDSDRSRNRYKNADYDDIWDRLSKPKLNFDDMPDFPAPNFVAKKSLTIAEALTLVSLKNREISPEEKAADELKFQELEMKRKELGLETLNRLKAQYKKLSFARHPIVDIKLRKTKPGRYPDYDKLFRWSELDWWKMFNLPSESKEVNPLPEDCPDCPLCNQKCSLRYYHYKNWRAFGHAYWHCKCRCWDFKLCLKAPATVPADLAARPPVVITTEILEQVYTNLDQEMLTILGKNGYTFSDDCLKQIAKRGLSIQKE